MEYGKTYGSKTETTSTIFMCGGCSEWWNYKLIFNVCVRPRKKIIVK